MTMMDDTLYYNITREDSVADNQSVNVTMTTPGGLNPAYELYYTSMWYRTQLVLSHPHQIIALLLACLAIASNILSIVAIRQCKWSLHGCYFKLLMSLSISDVLIGLSLVLHKLSRVFNPAYKPGAGPAGARLRFRCTFMVIKALSNTALNSTLLNLMAMALDHYIAIIKPLHYHMFMSDRRRHILIASLWLLAVLLGFSDFFSGIGSSVETAETGVRWNYCEVIFYLPYHEEYCTFGLAAVCLCVMSYIYIRIYGVVRHQQQRDKEMQQQSQVVELKKNKKALYTTLLVLGFFILCWLPNCLFQIVMMIKKHVAPLRPDQTLLYHTIDQYLADLLFLNAICDPIIYVSRMREVRHGYSHIFYFCCKCFYKYPPIPHRRRLSESLTLDYTISHQRTSSAAAISNGSGSGHRGVGKRSNSTQSNRSFQNNGVPRNIEIEKSKANGEWHELSLDASAIRHTEDGLSNNLDVDTTKTSTLDDSHNVTESSAISMDLTKHQDPLLSESIALDLIQGTVRMNGSHRNNNGIIAATKYPYNRESMGLLAEKSVDS